MRAGSHEYQGLGNCSEQAIVRNSPQYHHAI
jgi:hypothetical protein